VGWLHDSAGNCDEQVRLTWSKGGDMEGAGEVPYLKEILGTPSKATTRWRLRDCTGNDDGERGPDKEREEGKPRRVPSA
jgi:hypothetical protein